MHPVQAQQITLKYTNTLSFSREITFSTKNDKSVPPIGCRRVESAKKSECDFL
jgi:hypothetical protein